MNFIETAKSTSAQLAWRASGQRSDLPHWIDALLKSPDTQEVTTATSINETASDAISTRVIDAPDATLVSVTSEVDTLDKPNGYTAAAIQCYETLFKTLQAHNAKYPIRMWNFVPNINEVVEQELNRYMQFNMGRHKALADWYGSPVALKQLVATASGVGHSGSELIIHCLSLKNHAGLGVENPRQIPAYNYSRRFGPASPSFARATLASFPSLDSRSNTWLMVGGTASVVGEDSQHPGQLCRQIDETLDNLSSLVNQAQSQLPVFTLPSNGSLRSALNSLNSIRVYYVRANDLTQIKESVIASFPNITECEFLNTSLCRPELLVEIEGAGLLKNTPSNATCNGKSSAS